MTGASGTPPAATLPSLPSDKRECPVCYETFADQPDTLQPRQLTCGHIACTGCLEAELCDGEITCPECFTQTQVAAIADLERLQVVDDGGGGSEGGGYVDAGGAAVHAGRSGVLRPRRGCTR